MEKGQGAIEYLLLLAAAIVVVAIVITFMMQSISTTEDVGTRANFDYLCKKPPRGLGSDTNTCKCYRGEIEKNECCGMNIEEGMKDILGCSS